MVDERGTDAIAAANTKAHPNCDAAATVDPRQEPSFWAENLLGSVFDVASRRYTPRLYGQGNVGFQLTRGLLGVSM